MSNFFEDRNPFAGTPRTMLVGVVLGRQPPYLVEEHLDELGELALAAGADVVGRTVQRRDRPSPSTFIGRGKAEEIAIAVDHLEADLVLFDDDLSPSQVKALEKITGRAVMDRSGLILEIFHQRARSGEARTQVELARLEYLLPRLTRLWSHLSRQVGGIGVRGGAGEKQLEADRRMLRRRISALKQDLGRIERTRDLQRRGRHGVVEIALAGYTNAGKSTLFNRLTGGDVLVRDQLFATLDAKLKRGHVIDGRTAVFSDTVGFIRKLPHHLVASFRSTLQQVVQADQVLHVIDRSHPRWRDQLTVGEEVLRDLEVEAERILTVYNKVDRLGDPDPVTPADTVAVSALTGAGVDALRETLGDRLGWTREPLAEAVGATLAAD